MRISQWILEGSILLRFNAIRDKVPQFIKKPSPNLWT